MNSDITKKTILGVSWNFIRVITQTVFSIIVMGILGRLLPPSDFGLLAVALIFVGFAELLSSLGMGAAVIQKKELFKDDIQIAQTLSFLMAIALTIFSLLIAESISLFYQSPNLENILIILSFSLFFNGLGAVSRSLLMREMAFKKLFFIDICVYIISYPVIAVLLAYNDFGVWSLVWGHMSLCILTSILVLLVKPVQPSFNLKKDKVKKLFNFGAGVSLISTIGYIAANIDYLIIMRFLNSTKLGFYSRAFHLITLPLIKISISITSVLFPSMSSIQNQYKLLKKSYFKSLESIALITFPILFVFFVAAETVVIGVFGDQWYGAINVFKILTIAGIFKSLFHLSGVLAQATNYVYADLKRLMIYLIGMVFGCLYFIEYGIEAIAWVTVSGSLFLYIAKAQLALKIIDGCWSDYFKAQIPGVSLSISVGFVDYLFLVLNENVFLLSHWLSLIIIILLSAISFFLFFFMLPKFLIGDSPLWVKEQLMKKLLNKKIENNI